MNKKIFNNFHVSPEIERAVSDMGFTSATPIQEQSIPLISEGVDIIGKSQTGTGKTAAFLIPVIDKIDENAPKRLEILILCPTRELAMQAADEARKLTRYKSGIKTVAVYGGEPITRQLMALKRGVNIVIGTPGRIMDHMKRRTLKLDHLKTIILDEADEMLSMGFVDDIETILKSAPEDVQTVLFSATMPKAIMDLTKKYQTNPQLIEIDRKQITVNAIEQVYYMFPMARKDDGLCTLLKYYRPKLSLVFCNTKKKVEEIYKLLTSQSINCDRLHGDMKQSQRTEVMGRYKTGKLSVLVATDVAARGIDVENIDMVFNYDLPQNDEYYVHRIGRTGRAGKSGMAINLVSGRRQLSDLMQIAKKTKSNIEKKEIPSGEEMYKRENEVCIEKMKGAIEHKSKDAYMHIVDELEKEGYSQKDIALTALSLLFGRREQHSSSSSPRGEVASIAISIGREQGIAPNFIVGAICERCDLRGSDIGKIEIYDHKTVVQVPQRSLEHVLEAMVGCKINGIPTQTNVYQGGGEKRPSSGNSRASFSGGPAVRRKRRVIKKD